MGDWEKILLERRVLTWVTMLSLVGTGLWVAALATPYWLVLVPKEQNTTDIESETSSQFNTSTMYNISNNTVTFDIHNTLEEIDQMTEERRILWAHSGLFQKCQLVEEVESLHWEC